MPGWHCGTGPEISPSLSRLGPFITWVALGESKLDLFTQLVEAFVGRPGDKQRTDLGANEVVGAACAQESKIARVGGVDELQHVGRVGKAGDEAALGTEAAAQEGGDGDGQVAAIGARGNGFATETHLAFSLRVAVDELAEAIDDRERVQVPLALRLAPGEEPGAAEDDAVAAGILLHGAAHHEAKLEAGPLP